jgi:hypothetical protein
VRAEAARGLAYFPGDVSVLEALLAGLDDDKFVVVYECDHALEALTGVNQPAVARAWRQWYQANREKPFANAPAPSDATTQRPWYDIMNLFE